MSDDIDFTNEDWMEVRKAIWKNASSMRPKEFNQLKKFYPKPEGQMLLEMAWPLNKYRELIVTRRQHLLFTICNICCLEYLCPDDVRHWLMELKEVIYVLSEPLLKDKQKKDKHIKELLYDYCNSIITSDDLFIKALDDEINKGTKTTAYNSERKKKDVPYIQDMINDVPEIRKQNEKRMLDCIKAISKYIVSFKPVGDDKTNKENFSKTIPPVLYRFMESNPNFEFDEDMFKVK